MISTKGYESCAGLFSFFSGQRVAESLFRRIGIRVVRAMRADERARCELGVYCLLFGLVFLLWGGMAMSLWA